jgi:hypothetical protein
MSVQTNFRAQDMIGAQEQKAAKKPAPVAPVVVAPPASVVVEEPTPEVVAEKAPESEVE